MDILDDEILQLWSLHNKNKTIYLMVGGFAATLHGFNRNTEDIDIWIKDTIENRIALRVTLKELGIGDFEGIETTQFIPEYTSIILNPDYEIGIVARGENPIKQAVW